jgi:hypothetical protein
LANLPKTLDETYERIFFSINKDDWPIAQSALSWIFLHEQTYGRSIPTSTLIQAIEHELSVAPSQFFDETILWDTMGCLIRVSAGRPFLFPKSSGVSCYTVSFAHYTVLEFLRCSRMHPDLSPHFSLPDEPTNLSACRTIFNVALDPSRYSEFGSFLEGDEDPEGDDDLEHDEDTQLVQLSSLSSYCAMTSVFIIARMSEELASLGDLKKLVWKLFDPTWPHFKHFHALCKNIHRKSGVFPKHIISPDFLNLQFLKEQPVGSHAGAFLGVVLVSCYDVSKARAMAMLDEHPFETMADEDMNLVLSRSLSANVLGSDKSQRDFILKGTFVEVLAEIAALFNPNRVVESICRPCVEEGGIDCSKLILYRVCSGLTNPIFNRNADPFLALLLAHANPAGVKSRVTPLQVSVALCDYQRTLMLLEAGADSNFLSNDPGTIWDADSPLNIFNRMADLSPLWICQNPECLLREHSYKSEKMEKWRARVEGLLIRYGARSFKRPLDEVES